MGRLEVVSGNIFNYLDDKDLIVNSANKYMICGGGVCGAIYKKANKELLEDYCKHNFKEYMKINEVRFSPGFELGLDILHICSPKYYESKEPLKDLLDSYNNVVIEAKKKGYKSIVSVSLGCGVNGYKHNDIAFSVISKLKELVNKYDIDFMLVLPSEEIKEVYSIYNSKGL